MRFTKSISFFLIILSISFTDELCSSDDNFADMSNIIVINTSGVEIGPENIKFKYKRITGMNFWEETLGGYDAVTFEKKNLKLPTVDIV